MDNGQSNVKVKASTGNVLLFLLPSLLGIFLFMTPIPQDEGVTIPIALLSGFLQDHIGQFIPAIMTVLIIITVLGSFIAKLFKPDFIMNNAFLNNLFAVNLLWLIIRLFGGIFAVMTLFKIGPEMVWGPATGGTLLSVDGLLTILFSVFLFAGLFLPLLLNFGLLELLGALLTKVMRPLFGLPGRSSIDALASWLGDGTIGVLLTSKQYEEGYYTKKEAAIIGTTFSVVSITFSLVVIAEVGLGNYFLPFYGAVILSGVVAALIMPRIPPLSRKPNTYYNGQEGQDTMEVIPEGYSRFGYGFHQALVQARKNNDVAKFFKDGFKNVLDMWLGVAPIVMAIGTTALIIAENTPVFGWIGMPFIPILELLQVPEAGAASESILVGFADMFLPALFAEGIQSELTRFVIASVSVTQLIYLSEVGGLLLGSKIPVSFKDLAIIFLERTIITLPIIVLIGHLVF
ncbi:YjiH family protein [Rossellomorea vietnamensis]|uniref:YjiH family protein n=2 Tax=Rossellomorea TaxID=2837508 RepID=A0A5D4KEW6_9BACI|nr:MULTISPECIES: YjiH family protein [Rossellomorea]TYR75370.1 YjiH family protein [Rossellomorea vietnamensis]TYS78332.1 YjiH family protein [Rossellomorea aquimaris]